MLFILYNVHLYYFLLRCVCFFWSWRQIPYFYPLEWIKIVLIRGYDIDMECVCFFLQNIVKNKILCGFWWNGGICLWIKVVFILAILGFYRTLELLKIFGGKSRSCLWQMCHQFHIWQNPIIHMQSEKAWVSIVLLFTTSRIHYVNYASTIIPIDG